MVFTVEGDGGGRFPGFQFAPNRRALPVVAKVIEVFGEQLQGWALALWFTGSNDWLGGQRPVDVQGFDAEQVVDAAQRLRAELLG